jgi:histidinol-phosphate aminotransferase
MSAFRPPSAGPHGISRRNFFGLAAGTAALALSELPLASASGATQFLAHTPPAGPAAVDLWRDYVGRLCYNENPLGPSPLARAAMSEGLDLGHRYSDWYAESLRQDLAGIHQVGTAQIVAGCGGTEMLHLCALGFAEPGGNVIYPIPSYGQFDTDCAFMGASVRYVPLDANHRINLNAMASQVDGGTFAVGLTNPNNPTATALSASAIASFVNSLPAGVVTVIDEAYHEYVHDPNYASAVDLVRQGKDVVVIRTFSKIFGLAGVRIGYAVGPANRMAAAGAWQTWGTVSRPALDASRAALNDSQHISDTVSLNDQAKAYCFAEFGSMGLTYIPSETNFFMVNVGRSAAPVAAELAARGVNVRTGWGMPQHLRVSTGTMEDMQAFITALREILGPSGVSSETSPRSTALYGNYPNPVISATRIVYSIGRPSKVELRIFDAQGRLLRTLVDAERAPGFFDAPWDRLDESGRRVPAGCYFYRLGAAEVTQTRRMILI